jgi:hypothetical protein
VFREKEAITLMRYLIQKISAIQRFLIGTDMEIKKAIEELLVLLDYLETAKNYGYSRKINQIILEVTNRSKLILKEMRKINCDV